MSNYYLSNSTNTLNDIFDASNTSGSINTGFYQNCSQILYTPSTFTGTIGNAGSNTTGYYSNNVDLYNIYSSKYQVFLNTQQNAIMESLNTGSSNQYYTTNQSLYTSWQNESSVNNAPTATSVPTTSYPSYTIPSYCKSFSALLFAGGGGSGGGKPNPGGGGGGGGFSVGYWTVVSGQTTISITVGSGGLGGYNIGGITNGQDGTNTTVTYNEITVTAYGGAGGVYNSTSSASGGLSTTDALIKNTAYDGMVGNSGHYYGQSGNPSPSGKNYGGTVGYPLSSSKYPTTSNMSTLINYTFIPSSLIPLLGIGSGGKGTNQPITYDTGLGLPGMAVLFFYY